LSWWRVGQGRDLDRHRQVKLQDVTGELDLLVAERPHENRGLAIADEPRKALARIADDQRIDLHRRELRLQYRRNRTDFLQYPMRNILRRHSFSDQPMDGILSNTARME